MVASAVVVVGKVSRVGIQGSQPEFLFDIKQIYVRKIHRPNPLLPHCQIGFDRSDHLIVFPFHFAQVSHLY